jgi:hypothetical protein
MTTGSPIPSFTSARALALHRTSVSNQQGLFQLLMGEDELYTKAEASRDFDTCIGNYRVVALGPKSKDSGKYAWAVVSTPFKTSLYILARDVKVCMYVYTSIHSSYYFTIHVFGPVLYSCIILFKHYNRMHNIHI